MKLMDFPGIQKNVPLRGYSTFNVGGPADYFINLDDVSVLPDLLAAANADEIPFFVLGGGSNVLFMDEGYRGLIIRMVAEKIHIKGRKLVAEAGAKWPVLLKTMRGAGLTGLEPFDGLPGSIGGAVAGNAGCFGAEMKDFFESAILYDHATRALHTVTKDDLAFSYRGSALKKNRNIVLEVTLALSPVTSAPTSGLVPPIEAPATLAPSGPVTISQTQRVATQPPGRSSGSFFKNPSPEQPAGLLIDQCGLKGHQIGGAQISPKHGNFFMNVDNATAHDLLALRDLAQSAVRAKFGIELEEEVVIMGSI